MRYLRTNTATRITVGPFFDKTDGVTPETGLTATNEKLTMTVDDAGVPTLVLDANATASGGSNDFVHISGDDAGFYDLELAAANVNYLGRAMLAITYATDHCPVFHEFMILPAMIYDSMVLGTDRLDVNVTHVADSSQSSGDVNAKLDTIDNFVDTEIADLGNRLPAALVSGRMDASVGAMASSVLTAAALAADSGLKPFHTGTAQGGSGTTITLASGASSNDSHYSRAVVVITGGSGAGQSRPIYAYNGTSKVATVGGAWGTAPDNTSTYAVIPQAMLFFNEDGNGYVEVSKWAGIAVDYEVVGVEQYLPKMAAMTFDFVNQAESDINAILADTGDIEFILDSVEDIQDRVPSSTAATNMTMIFDTDIAQNYDTTQDTWTIRIREAPNFNLPVVVEEWAEGGVGSNFQNEVAAALASEFNSVDSDLTTLLGRLTSTRAGYLDKLNITGNVANQASVDTIDDFLDTEVATIVTQTSAASIRSAVGLASANLDTQFSGVNSKLDIIDNFLDTEMASVQTAVETTIPALILSAWTTSLPEPTYRANGAAGSPSQILYELLAHMGEKEVDGTTLTLYKLNGTTPAATFTLDDADDPHAISRAA